MIAKVIAYITRQRNGIAELLVFEHVDVDAGVQVPKGTMEPNETLEAAVIREVREETGLTSFESMSHLGAMIQPPFAGGVESEEWCFFAMTVDGSTPDAWVHRVGGKGEDEGMRFRYYWLPLEIELAGRQGNGLHLLSHIVHELHESTRT